LLALSIDSLPMLGLDGERGVLVGWLSMLSLPVNISSSPALF
jgi:hypothetical protein